MKVYSIGTEKSNVAYKNNVYKTKPIVQYSNNQIQQYSPPYYTNNIAFKGMANIQKFEKYFPTKALNLSELDFDGLMKKGLKDTKIAQNLQRLIYSITEKNYRTKDFVDTWKSQVPTLIPPIIMGMPGSSGAELARKGSFVFPKLFVGENLTKFVNSKHKDEIIKKDLKTGASYAASNILFDVANKVPTSSPEMIALRTALYILAFTFPSITQKLRKNEQGDIKDLYFIDATKELINLGELDPLDVINCVTEGEFKDYDKEGYKKWKDKRLLDLRFLSTGTYVTAQDDFLSDEAKNVLDQNIKTLSLGFSDDKDLLAKLARSPKSAETIKNLQNSFNSPESIPDYLRLLGIMYWFENKTNETEYLLKETIQRQNELNVKNLDKINVLSLLSQIQEKNDKPIASRNALKEVLRLSKIEAPNDIETINRLEKKLLFTNLDILNSLSKKEELLKSDLNISIKESRKKSIQELISLCDNEKDIAINDISGSLEKIKKLPLNKGEVLNLFDKFYKLKLSGFNSDYTLLDSIKSILKTGNNIKLVSPDDLAPEVYYGYCALIKEEFPSLTDIENIMGKDSFYVARYIEEEGFNNDNVEKIKEALNIYKSNFENNEVDINRCEIRRATLENDDVNLIINENTDFSSFRKDIVTYKMKDVNETFESSYWNNIDTFWVKFAPPASYISQIATILKFNPDYSVSLLDKFRSKYNTDSGFGSVVDIPTLVNPIPSLLIKMGVNLLTKDMYSNIPINEDEIINLLIEKIDEDNDPFYVNIRGLLYEKMNYYKKKIMFSETRSNAVKSELIEIENNLGLPRIQ